MLKIAFWILALYLLLIIVAYFFQRQMIYLPQQEFPSPRDAGVPEMRVIQLKTSDDLVLRGWYRPPIDPKLPTILYLHGNAGHIGYRAPIISPYLKRGFGVLLLTYRGYSGNPGKPTEEGLYRDARAAMEFLIEKGAHIVPYGNSIGAAVAIQIATEYPIEALVLQSPFSSLTEVGQTHYPIFPLRWLLKDRYNSIAKAPQVQAPVLILSGEEDKIIPPELARKLFEAFSEPKEMRLIPNRGHNDLFEPEIVISFIENLQVLNSELTPL